MATAKKTTKPVIEEIPVEETVTEEVTSEKKVVKETKKTASVNVRLNFREAKSLDSAVLAILEPDTKIQVNKTEGEWLNVTHDGKAGYVKKEFVTVEK